MVWGFASVLVDLGLRRDTWSTRYRWYVLPLAFAVRHSWGYRRVAMGLGSLLIVVVGATWLLDRSLALDLGLF